jgi:uncharacterized protein (UPF0261 family)
LAADWECLVFHATGTGGRSMEKLIDSGAISTVIDVTTTEVADMLMGGVLPADEDRFGAIIRTRTPYIGSVGALDMVNFGSPDTGTTEAENEQFGRWIGERLNLMDGPVRFFLPELGISALDQPGQAFHDPRADSALFAALERTVRQTSTRQLIRVKRHINDPEFAAAIVAAFRTLHGDTRTRRVAGGRE